MTISETEGILLIDKPKGITSFDVIRRLRLITGKKKFGHAGTLDPLASGLLIIGVGAATKKLQGFLKLSKVYEAEVLLGRRTDTGDIEGKTIDELRIKNYELREEEIQKTLKGMMGRLELPVPRYSAIKRGGEALYKKARRGEHFTPPVKPMEVTNCELLAVCHPLQGLSTFSLSRNRAEKVLRSSKYSLLTRECGDPECSDNS